MQVSQKRIGIIFLLFISLPLLSNAAVVMGNPNGTIELTEIVDYQCPHCQAMSPVIDQLIQQHNELRVKLLPVAILNQDSIVQASFAVSRALYHQDFYQAHALLMRNNHQSPMGAQIDKMTADHPALLKEMHSPQVKAVLDEGLNKMQQLNLHETPILLISPRQSEIHPIVLVGEQSLEKLNQLISILEESKSNGT